MLKAIQKEAFLSKLDQLINKLAAQREPVIARNSTLTILDENVLYQHLIQSLSSVPFERDSFLKQLGRFGFDGSTILRTIEICKRICECCTDSLKYTVVVDHFISDLSKRLILDRKAELLQILALDLPCDQTEAYIRASTHFARDLALLRDLFDKDYDLHFDDVIAAVRGKFLQRPLAQVQMFLQKPVDASYRQTVALAFDVIEVVLRTAPNFFGEGDRREVAQCKQNVKFKEAQHWNSKGDQMRSAVESIYKNLVADLQRISPDFDRAKSCLQGVHPDHLNGFVLLERLSPVLTDNAAKMLNEIQDLHSFTKSSQIHYVFPFSDKKFDDCLRQIQTTIHQTLSKWLERIELQSFETSSQQKLSVLLSALKEIQRLSCDYHEKDDTDIQTGDAYSKCEKLLKHRYNVSDSDIKSWDGGRFLNKRVPLVRIHDLRRVSCLQPQFAIYIALQTETRFQASASQLLKNFERDFEIHGNICAITRAVNHLPECKECIPEYFGTLKRLNASEHLQQCEDQLTAAVRKQQDRNELEKKLVNEDFASIVCLFVAVSTLHRDMSKLQIVLDYQAFERSVCDALRELFDEGRKQMHHFLTSRQPIDDDRYILKQASVFSKCFECFRKEGLLKSFLDDLEAQLAATMQESLKEASRLLGEKEFDQHAILICKLMHVRTLLASRGIDCPCLSDVSVKVRCETMLRESKNVTEVSHHILTLQRHPVLGNASNEALREFPELRDVYRQLCNEKMSFMNFDKVCEDLTFGSPSHKEKLSQTSRDRLKAAFDACMASFTDIIDQFIHGNRTPGFQVSDLLDTTKAEMLKLKPAIQAIFAKRLSLGQKSSEVGSFLGFLFGAWSICSDKSTIDKKCILQPHPAQIVCILMLLGIDEAKGPSKNHVMELLTGEGKSIVLGALATFFAYFGYSVDVVCYNPFLSQRDWNLFKFVFGFFDTADRIHYCDIDSLINRAMDTGAVPDLTEVAEAIAQQRVFKPSKSPVDPSKRILLIDEVDVFFGENFYGQRYSSVHVIDNAETRELLRYMFDNRSSLSNPKAAYKSIQKLDCVQRLHQKYPNLDRFLPRQVELMVQDLQNFQHRDLNPYELDKDSQNVCYIDHKMSGKNTNQLYGYMTFWAYLHEVERGEICYDPNVRTMGVQLFAGSILYSDLPKRYHLLLGLSGTVSELSSKDLQILANYQVSKCSFMPSTFEKTLLRMDQAQQVITDPKIEGFYDAIKNSIQVELKPTSERTILVVFKDKERLKGFETFLQNRPINKGAELCVPGVLSDDISFGKRDACIKAAMFEGGVTLMTRSYGRGTDFICSSKTINDRGGVHIIQTFLPMMISETKQIKGRTCRQDNNGSYREIFWAQDIADDDIATFDELRCWLKSPAERAKIGNIMGLLADHSNVEDIIEMRRCQKDDARVDKMLQSDIENSQQCRDTESMVDHQMNGLCSDALRLFEDFQNEWFGAPSVVQSVHTVFILDESGSMSGEPWSNLQQSVRAYLNELSQKGSPDDRVSIIQFASEARIFKEFVSVADAESSQLVQQAGGTQFVPPLEQTKALLGRDQSGYDVVLVFMTDGVNEDDMQPVPILQKIFSRFKDSRSMKFNAIAFGENPASLRAMVNAVGDDGTYSHASDAIQLQRSFVEIARKMISGSTRIQQAASPASQSSSSASSFGGAAKSAILHASDAAAPGVGDTVVLQNLEGNLRVFDTSVAVVKRKTSQALEVELISPREAVSFSQGKPILVQLRNAQLKRRSAVNIAASTADAAASAVVSQDATAEPPDELRDMYVPKDLTFTIAIIASIAIIYYNVCIQACCWNFS